MDDRDAFVMQIEDLRTRLAEAEETLEAIRSGGVDALVIYGREGEQIFTLEGADHPYRVMFETINEGAATLSADGLVLYANEYLAGLLKTPLESLLGSPFFYYISPQDRKAFEAILDRSLQEKCKTEIYFQAGDKTPIPVLLSLSPLITPEQVSICIAATDITEQKRNAEILAAERLANSIIEQVAEVIVVCDAKGKIIRASQATHHLLGQNPLFKPFDDLFPLQIEPASFQNRFSLQAVLEGESFSGIEAVLERQPDLDESPIAFNLLISATPLTGADGDILGCVIAMMDVTERRQAEEAIQKYAQQLERSNKDLEDFAFIASHDLQEPLRKIQAFGERLIQDYSHLLQEEGYDYIYRMQNSANRMQNMILDLLAYSRISTKAQLLEPVDLNQVVRGVLLDLEMRIEKTGGVVELDVLPVVKADPVQMRQLLQNLIGNALKFHRKDIAPLVKIGTRSTASNWVEFYVEDNGIGFEMQFIDRIFQPFQRLHGRSEFDGSGIGLAICRKIVERHRGKISAYSVPGNGATFVVAVPTNLDKT